MYSKKRTAGVVAFGAALSLVGAGLAQADTIYSDAQQNVQASTQASGNVLTGVVGTAEAVTYWLANSGSPGCDAPVNLGITVPEHVTAQVGLGTPVAGPTTITLNFTECGTNGSPASKVVTYTADQAANSPGYHLAAVSSVNSVGDGPADFFFKVAAAPEPKGNTASVCSAPSAPTVTLAAAPDGTNEWFQTTPVIFSTADEWQTTTGGVASGWSTTKPSQFVQGTTTIDARNKTTSPDKTNTCYSSVRSVRVKFDNVKPYDIDISVSSPIYRGSTPTGATCTAKDVTSGVPEVGGCSVTAYDTASVGTRQVTGTATDNAGNTDTKAKDYMVTYGGVPIDGDGTCGIRQPILCTSTTTFSRGKTVPVKFGLLYDETPGSSPGSLITPNTSTGFPEASTWGLTATQSGCSSNGKLAPVPAGASVAAPTYSGALFRYDAAQDQYVYNAALSAKNLVGTCWQLTAVLSPTQSMKSAVFKVTN